MPSKIEEYALIGDTHTAGLVSRDGSIDWLCLPRFDSAACFAALLGGPEHGRWLLGPAGVVHRIHRRYRPGTLVLETEYETVDGSVAVVDCMPIREGYPTVVRMVEGQKGCTRMQMKLVVRFDYGLIVPWVRNLNGMLTAMAGPDAVCLRADVDLHREQQAMTAEFTVSAGQCLTMIMTLTVASWSVGSVYAATAKEIDVNVDVALKQFIQDVRGGKDFLANSKGILVLPKVIQAGVGIGGEYGEGELRIEGKTVSYYNMASASLGVQLGGTNEDGSPRIFGRRGTK